MKKFLILMLFLMSPLLARAAWIESFNMASATFTTTNEGPIVIPNTPPGTVLLNVNVSSVSAGGGLRIFNSSGTATSQIANIDLSGRGFYDFEILLSSGLTYATVGNVGGVTITFKRTRPQ